MNWRPSLLRSASLATALPLALVACNAGSSGQTSAPGASASPSAAHATEAVSASAGPTAATAPMRMHDQGRAGMLFREASQLSTLTDAQKGTLAALETKLQGTGSPKDEMKAVQTDIVVGIRANKIDAVKLQTDFAAVEKVTQAHAAAEADAINGLHAALDGGQRGLLVAAIRAKQAAHDAHRDAHDEADAGTAEWAKRRVDRLAKQLDLDDTQEKAVAAIVAKDPVTPREMQSRSDEAKQKMDAMMTAFAGETFDAKAFETAPGSEHSPRDMMQKDAAFVTQLLPILKPEQRETLAIQRERMTPGMGMGHRPGGDGPSHRGAHAEGAEGAGSAE